MLSAARQGVLENLRDVPMPPQVQVAVSPGTRVLTDVGRGLAEAESALDLAVDAPDAVVDAVALGGRGCCARWAGRRWWPASSTSSWARQAGRRTDTAAALHLQRQSLYQRLDRSMTTLGNPEPGSNRWGAVALAVELEVARRRDQGTA